MEKYIYLNGPDEAYNQVLFFRKYEGGYLKTETGDPENLPAYLPVKEAEKLREFLNYHYPKD